jgi:CheY-like chemotaxis protein
MNNPIQTAWIIDDDEIYKYGFRKYVTIKGLCSKIVDFPNGNEAINFLKDSANIDNLPDVIFLDIDMPVMDGWEFIVAFEQIKACINKKIAIFLVTSCISYQDIVRVQNHPDITDYIIKPIDSQQFSAVFNGELIKAI